MSINLDELIEDDVGRWVEFHTNHGETERGRLQTGRSIVL